MENKPKCYAPYLGVFYRTNNNRISPCCQYLEHSDPNEYDWQKVANDVELGEESKNCVTCYDREKYGKTSLRHSFDKYKESFAPDWKSGFKPVYADVRTSNFCNLQCNMCSPLDSSKIESFVKLNPQMEKYFKEVGKDFKNQAVNVPVANLEDLKVLKVAGGEPTIDPMCKKFLDQVCYEHITSDMDLWVTTNATKMIPFLQTYKPKFRKLCVTLSLDATGDILEFIRYPARWKDIESNINDAIEQELCDDMNVNIVVQPYNLLTLKQWLPWFSEFRKRVPRTKIVFLECTTPKHFSLRAMPNVAKDAVRASVQELRTSLDNMDDKLDELDKMLDKSEYKREYHQILLEYTDDIAVTRGMGSVYDKFPEFNVLKVDILKSGGT